MENKPQQNDDKKLQFAFFNDAMFDARRLYVAPILIVVGFIVEIIAILFKSKKQ